MSFSVSLPSEPEVGNGSLLKKCFARMTLLHDSALVSMG